MTTHDMTDELDVLVCEYEKRPKDAPSFFDLQPAIRGLRREPGTLVVEFDSARAPEVEQLVAAERLCCPTIGWELIHSPTLHLRIQARPGQLAMFEQFLAD